MVISNSFIKNLFYLLFLVALVSDSGCGDSNTTPNNIPPKGDEGQVIAVISDAFELSMLTHDVVYAVEPLANYTVRAVIGKMKGADGYYQVSVTVFDRRDEKMEFTLSEDFTEGSAMFTIYSLTNPDEAIETFASKVSGSISFTEMTDKKCAGTFNFKARNLAGSKWVEVQSGQFAIEKN